MAREPKSALADGVVARLTTAFEAAADPVAAEPMRRYMRDQFPFLGITTAAREPLCRAAMSSDTAPHPADVEAVVRALWRLPEREYRYAAAGYLRRHAAGLPASFLGVVRDLITTDPWWDTVDELAIHCVGGLVRNHPELVADMDEWIDADDIWLARSAILHQNRWKDATDADRLFAYCLRRAPDTEFFLRKAIGWALREYSKTDPVAVRTFVGRHEQDLSGLSRREALKWLERRARASS